MDVSALDAAIDASYEHAVGFLERLVERDSSLGREAGALEVFSAEMSDLGFVVERVPFDEGLASDSRAGAMQEVETERYSAYASLRDGRHTSLMLHGHIDVVPAATPQLWATPPFQPHRVGDRLYGRGAGDMKCGFAMGVLALRALREVEPEMGDWSISFLAAIEEECTGNGTLAAARQGYLADAVVVLEPTDLGLLLGGVGIVWVDITTLGRTAHAEQAHLAINPFDLLWRVIDALRQWTAGLSATVADPMLAEVESPYNLNVGQIHGGDWPSSVPTQATARIRIAFPRSWTPDEAQRRIVEQVALTSSDGIFPSPPTVKLHRLPCPGLPARRGASALSGALKGSSTGARKTAGGVQPREHHGRPDLCQVLRHPGSLLWPRREQHPRNRRVGGPVDHP